MTKAIHFGTSGHRGIIGQTFTQKHVVSIGAAISTYVIKQASSTTATACVCIGYDPREGNDPALSQSSYTKALVDTLLSYGINVWFCESFTPTPVISWVIQQFNLSGGAMLTASHNSPNYNGLKFNISTGAPAPTAVTNELETMANLFYDTPPDIPNVHPGTLTPINHTRLFCDVLHRSLLDLFQTDTIDVSDINLLVDARHGTSAVTWRAWFEQVHCDGTIIHEFPQSDFGGLQPNPYHPDAIDALRQTLSTASYDMVCANDPDADRHLILNELGEVVSPEMVTCIIADYFLSNHVPILGIASTIASSRILAKLTEHHQLEYYETRVGFKYFSPFLKKARSTHTIALAVESSGGFSASFHTLEKCGFLPAILLSLILKDTGKPLSQLECDSKATYGSYYFHESSINLNHYNTKSLQSYFDDVTIDDLTLSFPDPLERITKKDGTKIWFTTGDWILLRFSGTEPVLRLYSESSSPEKAQKLVHIISTLIKHV